MISLQRTQCEIQRSSQWSHGRDEPSWLQSGQDSDRNISEVVETVGGEKDDEIQFLSFGCRFPVIYFIIGVLATS